MNWNATLLMFTSLLYFNMGIIVLTLVNGNNYYFHVCILDISNGLVERQTYSELYLQHN